MLVPKNKANINSLDTSYSLLLGIVVAYAVVNGIKRGGLNWFPINRGWRNSDW